MFLTRLIFCRIGRGERGMRVFSAPMYERTNVFIVDILTCVVDKEQFDTKNEIQMCVHLLHVSMEREGVFKLAFGSCSFGDWLQQNHSLTLICDNLRSYNLTSVSVQDLCAELIWLVALKGNRACFLV